MKPNKKSTSEKQISSDKKEISVAKIGLISAITVAIIGLVGSAINAYFSSQAAQAPLLIPIQATQTAEARIILQTAVFSPTSEPVLSTNLPNQSPSVVPSVPANTPQLATCPAALDFGAWFHCDISTPGEIRTITFEADQDDYLYIRVINKNQGEMFSPLTTIYDPSGTKISEDYSNSGAERVIHLPSSGTYTVRVEDGQHAHTGEFVLYAQSLRNPTSAQIITPGVQLYSTFTEAFQEDVYLFDATTGEKVAIDVSEVPVTGPLTLRVIIYSPKGDQEYEDIGSSGVSALFTPISSGTYVMFVSNPSLNSTGEYFVFRK